jgi:hypothetical protein
LSFSWKKESDAMLHGRQRSSSHQRFRFLYSANSESERNPELSLRHLEFTWGERSLKHVEQIN